MAKRIIGSTPKQDGYRMPAEYEKQAGVWMLWPERPDNWRQGAKPAQAQPSAPTALPVIALPRIVSRVPRNLSVSVHLPSVQLQVINDIGVAE